MIVRFCLYSVFKNLRFADPFFVLYLLALGRSFTEIGILLGYQHLLTVAMEVPSGYLADRCGRVKSLVGCFAAYFACYVVLALGRACPEGLQLAGLWLALTCFGLGEAMRTGSHKAIILDYLDLAGQSARATEVIGLTRSYSKYSAGVSAVCGGFILFASQQFEILFWLSALPAAAGVVLMWTYPRHLDGECSRAAPGPAPAARSWREGLGAIISRPRALRLLLQSVLFESQIKVILKYYAQPVMTAGLGRFGVTLVASSGTAFQRSGALWVGLFELFRESLGGLAARASTRWERAFFGPGRALAACYVLATALGLLVVGSLLLWSKWLVVAGAYFVLLTLLQNVRRPVFVSALNSEMEKSMRATVLSVESAARSVCLAVTLPVVGLVADSYGLQYALLLPPLVLIAGWPLSSARPDRPGETSRAGSGEAVPAAEDAK
jgi:MFS family permease